MSSSLHCTILLGHPSPESLNHALATAYAEGAKAAGAEVTLIEVGALSFDPSLRVGYQTPQDLEPDLLHVQRSFKQAHHVVCVTPLWWSGVPAVFKGLLDRVLLPGWAYKMKPNGLPDGLLRGRSARMVMTMDSPAWWYWGRYWGSAHRALVPATLKFIGLSPVRSTTFYKVREADEDKRQRWIEKMRTLGQRDMESLRRNIKSS